MSRARAVSLILLACLTAPVAAQGPSRAARVWVAGGIGAAGSSAEGGAAFLAQLAYQRSRHQVALRAFAAVDPFSESCGSGLGDFALLYGRTLKGSAGHVTAATGVAAAFPSECQTPGGRREIVPGLPLALEAAVRLAPVAGLGVQLFGDLNSRGSFGGFVLFLQLGWLPR